MPPLHLRMVRCREWERSLKRHRTWFGAESSGLLAVIPTAAHANNGSEAFGPRQFQQSWPHRSSGLGGQLSLGSKTHQAFRVRDWLASRGGSTWSMERPIWSGSGMANGRHVGGKEGGAHTILFCPVLVHVHPAERSCRGLEARSLSLWMPQSWPACRHDQCAKSTRQSAPNMSKLPPAPHSPSYVARDRNTSTALCQDILDRQLMPLLFRLVSRSLSINHGVLCR